MTPLIVLMFALAGLMIGSFLHVCIYRLPRRESIVCVTPEPSTTYLPELRPDPRPEILRPLERGDSVSARLEMAVFTVHA